MLLEPRHPITMLTPPLIISLLFALSSLPARSQTALAASPLRAKKLPETMPNGHVATMLRVCLNEAQCFTGVSNCSLWRDRRAEAYGLLAVGGMEADGRCMREGGLCLSAAMSLYLLTMVGEMSGGLWSNTIVMLR